MRLLEMFCDNNNKVSMQRVLMIYYGFAVITMWLVYSIQAGKPLPLDGTTVALLVGSQSATAVQSALNILLPGEKLAWIHLILQCHGKFYFKSLLLLVLL